MAGKTIQTGLIGYGLSGRVFHAPFISLAEGFDLKCIAQRTADLSKLDYPQTKTVRSHLDILQDREIELVIVATPNGSHFELAKQVLLAGKHVIIEKPFSPTLAETNELIRIAEKNNLKLFVFHNRRWDADFLTVKQVIEGGLLGDIVSYEAHYDRFKPELNAKQWKETEGPGSGVLYDLGTHIIDQTVCLFGTPKLVTAQLLKQRTGTQIDDGFDLRLDYDALNVTLKSTLLARELGPKYIVYGRKGSFVKSGIDPQEDDMQAGLSPLSENWGLESQEHWGTLNTSVSNLNFRGIVESLQGNYPGFYENVGDVIRNNAPYAISPDSAQITTAIIENALESHKAQNTVTMQTIR
jgi:scyllo-inositol 2-dehydrogenase (NADP+)